MSISTPRLAVLIDSDNISYRNVGNVLNKLKNYGEITLKRAYGDFTIHEDCPGSKKGWKEFCNRNAINMIQTSQYREGKNTTDITLTIQAMTMLYSDLYDGFCIISSDSDFTPLVMALKERNKKVYIVGNKQTPSPLKKACNQFISIEDGENNTTATSPSLPKGFLKKLPELFQNSQDGWLSAAAFGKILKDANYDYKRLNPETSYGTLSEFIRQNTNIFKYKMKVTGNDTSNNKNMYVSLR
mgnify:CR=1 FL=1|jgi:hypothetical protein